MKITITTILIISIILGIIIYAISAFIRLLEKIKEVAYKIYIDYLKKFLLDVEEELIKKKGNPDNNTLLLEAKISKKKSLPDKILIMFFGKPGIDTDGEVFIIVSKTSGKDIEEGYSIKLVSDPLFATDSRDNFEYYKYSKKKYKRLKKLVNFIIRNSSMNIYWSTNTDQDLFYSRKQIIELIKESNNG